ncbi:DUF421 domain-containing protein [Alkalihalobacterium chitinilyticum]|uniref:DUF421 domain-containing protein n=1 Tax=Alkalihalobacterium chitinilyticum TaxID=2980103 RepID=A0ABT5V986_9BACI|nr:DUF421 domain-containing protein [Alkalihalobacterium chitinilyticum]MDE5412011.1 DUF421 domain-containing protein [Alkalihalobacterium chitinilyticum]
MDDILRESVIILARILTIFPLFLMVTIYMGKRSLGEMPIFDFLIIITLSNVIGADIADPTVDHIYTYLAVIVIPLLQKSVARLLISNRKLGKKLTFEPTLVIQDGKVLVENLRRIQYTIDNVLQMLRQKDIFDIREVKVAIIEGNGQMSVMKQENKMEVTIEDMNLEKKSVSLALPLIVEGEVYEDILTYVGLDRPWLIKELQKRRIPNVNRIFFASINQNQELHISLKKEEQHMPPFYH